NIIENLIKRNRIKILLIVLQEGEINISKLAKISKINYKTLRNEIEILKNKGYIDVISLGRSIIIRPNLSNPKLLLIKNLLEELMEI
ncbi:MAG: hypothetical protein QXH75_08825, partial [Sulfolobaceae archaeon]